jgi:hypothetical protein
VILVWDCISLFKGRKSRDNLHATGAESEPHAGSGDVDLKWFSLEINAALVEWLMRVRSIWSSLISRLENAATASTQFAT